MGAGPKIHEYIIIGQILKSPDDLELLRCIQIGNFNTTPGRIDKIQIGETCFNGRSVKGRNGFIEKRMDSRYSESSFDLPDRFVIIIV